MNQSAQRKYPVLCSAYPSFTSIFTCLVQDLVFGSLPIRVSILSPVPVMCLVPSSSTVPTSIVHIPIPFTTSGIGWHTYRSHLLLSVLVNTHTDPFYHLQYWLTNIPISFITSSMVNTHTNPIYHFQYWLTHIPIPFTTFSIG